jgi:O-antigen/teichoic acid export membrane protein
MSRLFKNVAYNVVGQGLVLALGFVGVKFIFSRLGADAFGIIYFNLVLTGVLTTALELGVLSTTIRQVSAHYAADREYVDRLIRTASFFYWGVGLVLFLAVFAAAPFLADRWINLKSIDHATATTMLRFLSVTTLIALPRALYASLFQGRQRMELNNSIDVGSSALQQLGVIFILSRGGDAFGVVQWIALSAVLSTATYMLIVARLFGARVLVPAYFSDVVRRNVGFTAHMGALSVLNMVLIQFDKVVVSKLLPIASVGYYSFASTVVVRISFAAGAIANAALPSFSDLHARDDRNMLLVQYRKLQDLITFGMVLPFTAATFAAIPIYTYLFNRQVAGVLLLPTALLCLGFFMGATVNIPYTFSVAIGKPYIASRTNVLALFVVIPVATVLIYLFGLVGAALTWVVYNLFVYAYMIPRICRECLGILVVSWYLQLLKVVALAGVTYGSAWLFIVIPHSYSTLALAAGFVAATITFAVGAVLLMGQDLRVTILRLPRRLLARQAGAAP